MLQPNSAIRRAGSRRSFIFDPYERFMCAFIVADIKTTSLQRRGENRRKKQIQKNCHHCAFYKNLSHVQNSEMFKGVQDVLDVQDICLICVNGYVYKCLLYFVQDDQRIS